MKLTVKDKMSRVVISVSMTFTLDQVEKMMIKHNLHFLPVVDNTDQCFGVISNTDLSRWHGFKLDFNKKQVWEVCTLPVIEVSPHLSIIEAAELMVANTVHHLVVTQKNVVTGILSSIDIVHCFILEGKRKK